MVRSVVAMPSSVRHSRSPCGGLADREPGDGRATRSAQARPKRRHQRRGRTSGAQRRRGTRRSWTARAARAGWSALGCGDRSATRRAGCASMGGTRRGSAHRDSSIAIIRDGRTRRPELRDDPTKTANRRIVWLDDATCAQLEGLRSMDPGSCRWGSVRSGRSGSAWWRRARDDAGVDPRWRLHDLRHWAATESIAASHDVRSVAGRLGHANPAMTLRVYAHAVAANDEALGATLAALLEPDPVALPSFDQ